MHAKRRAHGATMHAISSCEYAMSEDNLRALDNLDFSAEDLSEIDRYAQEGHVNMWAGSAAVTPA